MWMAYSEQSWPQGSDLKSCVEYMARTYEAMLFELEHSAIYKEHEDRMSGAADKCDDYLTGQIMCDEFVANGCADCPVCLIKELRSMQLEVSRIAECITPEQKNEHLKHAVEVEFDSSSSSSSLSEGDPLYEYRKFEMSLNRGSQDRITQPKFPRPLPFQIGKEDEEVVEEDDDDDEKEKEEETVTLSQQSSTLYQVK